MIIKPTYKEVLIVLNKPTVTGRTYTANSFKNLPLNVFGFLFNDVPMDPSRIDLGKIAFAAEDIRIENDQLVADIDFLNTPCGKLAYSAYQTGTMVFRPISNAIIDAKLNVNDAQIFAAFIIDKAQA